MSIYTKLLEIQREVDSFVKDKKSFGYNYSSGNQVLGVIRPLMNEKGLLLKQEVLKMKNTRQDYLNKNGVEKNEILTEASLRFTWIDVETGETDVCLFAANGFNDWEKGLGSALTYGERYFLLKYFHVPTDEIDPDNTNRKKEEHKIDIWLKEEEFNLVLTLPKEKIKSCLNKYNGQMWNDGKVYGMKAAFREKLKSQL